MLASTRLRHAATSVAKLAVLASYQNSAAVNATSSGTTLSITPPAEATVGRLMLIFLALTMNTGDPVTPTGWTKVQQTPGSTASNATIVVYSKMSVGSEPTVTITGLSNTTPKLASLLVYTGDGTVTAGEAVNGSGATSTVHSAVGLVLNQRIVRATMLFNSNGFSGFTVPAGSPLANTTRNTSSLSAGGTITALEVHESAGATAATTQSSETVSWTQTSTIARLTIVLG